MSVAQKESDFVQHEPCPSCKSQDNLARYTDGHAYCFGCKYYEVGSGEPLQEVKKSNTALIEVTTAALNKRGITEDTCKFWQYGIGTYSGQPVQVAQYIKEGSVIAQKLRFPSKDFLVLGETKSLPLFGQNLWRDGGRMVTVTEGEIDALTVSQLFGNKWPVVSVPSGAAGALKSFQANLEWLEKFDSVVIMFDDDEPGRKAALECAMLLTPGKAKISTIVGFKDANEAHVAGEGKRVIDAVYGGKVYRPDGVVLGCDLWDTVTQEDTNDSTPYPWAALNDKLLGIRKGELVVMTSGTGIGKSSVCREMICHLIRAGKKVGLLMLEESVKRTARNLMAIHLNTPAYFWADRQISPEQKKEAFDATVAKVVLFDHFGSVSPENLLARIRYMTKSCGCEYIFLDHLSIVVSGLGDGDERRLIDNAMTSLRSLVEETQCSLFVVSHLRRPDGDRGHEEGATTSLAQLRGSHAIAQLADSVIGLERNQQGDAPNELMIRVLKNRFTGDTGVAGMLRYFKESGRLHEFEVEINDEI
jgi:twinkle protein